MEEGVTQLADAGAMEDLRGRENDGIAVWLLLSRHSYHPHAHLAAQVRVTA